MYRQSSLWVFFVPSALVARGVPRDTDMCRCPIARPKTPSALYAKGSALTGQKVTVFSYWTWDQEEGLFAIAGEKRTQDEIEGMGGLRIPFTDQAVDEVDIGQDGAYRG